MRKKVSDNVSGVDLGWVKLGMHADDSLVEWASTKSLIPAHLSFWDGSHWLVIAHTKYPRGLLAKDGLADHTKRLPVNNVNSKYPSANYYCEIGMEYAGV
jgi:hypothetical protein